MSKMSNSLGWFLGIAIAGVSVSGHCVHAQITPDGTLPNNSTININGNIFNITGGTQAGANLFHSFQQFSIPTGSGSHFNNAVDIQNIISRVTGSSVSNIDGLIKVLGNANLFLLNPNGIVFGPNARLDIRGSFVASTANSIKFADGFEFSAKNAQSTPLLTVSVPLGLQFGANPGKIQVRGDGQGVRSFNDPIIDNEAALRVPSNQTLALVGGDISLEGGTLKTGGGRIELGSVSGEALVTLTPINKGFSFSYGGVQNFGNIQLSQQATVDTSGAGGGDVQVRGRSVTLEGGSQIETSTLASQPGGTLVLNASESVKVSGSGSGLFTAPYPGATGNAGDLTINTGTLLVQDEASVSTSTYGAGNAGNLTITADSVQLSNNGALYAQVGSRNATGNGGNLTIKTGTLLVQDGAFVSTSTSGRGNGGTLTVDASKKVEVTGASADYLSALFSDTFANATGNAGNLTINTPVLEVRDGAVVSAGTYGAGKGGNLTVNASEKVEVTGTTPNGQSSSRLEAGTYGTGNAGNLTINTRRLVVRDSQVSSATFGKADAGDLTVRASDSVELSGYFFDEVDEYPAGLFAQVSSDATGRAGNLLIETGRLSISNGAKVQVATFGQGDAGDLFIRASEIDIFETPQPRYAYYSTGIFAGIRSTRTATNSPKGNGGSITIETNRLRVRDGGVVTTTTQGQGNAGSLQIRATESIEVFGTAPGGEFRDLEEPLNSAISAAATRLSTGNAGSLSIDTGKLIVRDRGTVTVTSEGITNQAGNLQINARSINLDNQGNLTATSNAGQGGNILLQVQDILLMRRNSLISNTSGTAQQGGDEGNLTINAPSGFIVSLPNENSDIITNAFGGSGGRITILAQTILGTEIRNNLTPQSDIVALGKELQEFSYQFAFSPNPTPSVQLVDTLNIIDTSCAAFADGKGSEFTVTGRGGLPPSPNEPLSTDVVWSDTRTSGIPTQQQAGKAPAAKPPSKAEVVEIAPATGWVFDGKGQVTLISHASNPNALRSTPTSCPKQ